jgi:hypothetical protein
MMLSCTVLLSATVLNATFRINPTNGKVAFPHPTLSPPKAHAPPGPTDTVPAPTRPVSAEDPVMIMALTSSAEESARVVYGPPAP